MMVVMSLSVTSDLAVLTDDGLQGVTRHLDQVTPERLHSQNVG